MNCSVSANGQIFNGFFQIIHRVPEIEGSVEMKVSLPSKGDFNYRTVFKRTLNMCKFLRNPSKEIALTLMYNEFNKDGTLPKRCPIEPVKT